MSQESILVIEGSKMKAVRILLFGIGFVITGIFMIMNGEPWGWACSLFFGLAIPLAVLQLIRGSYLKLDNEGFEVKPGTKPWRLSWHDVESFYVGKIYGNKMIGINFSASYNKMNAGRKIASAVSGMEGAINSQFKLSPEKVCACLNEWKIQHGATKSA